MDDWLGVGHQVIAFLLQILNKLRDFLCLSHRACLGASVTLHADFVVLLVFQELVTLLCTGASLTWPGVGF